MDIDKRSGKTGQISEVGKVGRISDSETYAMSIMGSKAIMKEMFGPRADNQDQKIQLYQKLAVEGYASMEELPSDIEQNQTLNTISTFMIGAGINNDLLVDGLVLPRTLKSKNRQEKK